MARTSWLPVAMLAAGAGLLVAAERASPAPTAPIRSGGTLVVNLPMTDIDDIDPSIAYGTTSWALEYSTALKLVNYPDAPAPRGTRLVLEGASQYRVSRDGRKYTFTIRRGLRFSDGRPVTAANFAYAINRAANKDLQSPAFHFISDRKGTSIVGAQDVRVGKALTMRGVRVRGNKLVITLAKPDGGLLSKLTTPFFQALPLSLSRTEKVTEVNRAEPLSSAGPYYVFNRDPNRMVVLKRNPYYRGTRPRRLAAIQLNTNQNLDASYLEVRANRADQTLGLPGGVAAQLGREFGLGGRFRVRPSNCISFIALNTISPLFRANPQLRRAVNYAIDRRALIALGGEYTQLPTDQYLPQGFPGFKDIDAYPFSADLVRARRLAAGHVPPGGPWVYYYSLSSPGPQRMELVRAALREIGIEIKPQGFRGFAIYDAASKRSSPHAFTTGGFCSSFPDPLTLSSFFGSFFDDPVFNGRLRRADRLRGDARVRAYESIEHDLVTRAAPWAAWGQPTNQFFFSDRVDQRSFLYQPIYETPPYNVLALK